MRMRRSEKRIQWRGAIRVIAAMFLLFSLADLAFPQICGEDNEPLFPAQAAASAVVPGDDASKPQAAPTRAEDCFCCCSHIVAEDSPSPLQSLTLASDPGRIIPPAVPTAPVRFLFRPPRLA